MDQQRSEFVTFLRQAADFFEQHPDFPTPTYFAGFDSYFQASDDILKLTKGAGRLEKIATEYCMTLRKPFNGKNGFGTQYHIDLTTSRENVCERVQVGTKMVAAKPRQIIKAVKAHEEPVYEWKCSSILEKDDSK